jgi:hypothetical protein
MSVKQEKRLTPPRTTAIMSLLGAVAVGLMVMFDLASIIHEKTVPGIPVTYTAENLQAETTIISGGFELKHEGHRATLSIPLQAGFGAYLLLFLELLIKSAYIVLFILLSNIFHHVAKEKPFSLKNQNYLYAISWILISHALYTYLRSYLVLDISTEKLSSEAVQIESVAGFGIEILIFLGIITSVFAYILSEGHRIYEEQKLTI